MTPRADQPCPSAAEVEAAHDGRLGAADLARLDRHVAGCPACQSLRARLTALRAEARRAADLDVDDLAQRRARASLLQRAARPGPAPSPDRRGVVLACAAACALLVGASLWHRSAARPAAHPLARVAASADARWSRGSNALAERIALDDGTLGVVVPHQHRGHRFVVALPDGEIEVRGTRFVVEVRDRHTRRLDVTEGLVALRLVGHAEQLVAAGAHWSAAAVVARAEPAAVAPVAAPPPTPVASAHVPRVARPARVPRADAGVTAADPLGTFVTGLGALQRGDLAVAADDFADFERAHPDDERAEDAGYLRVEALRRAGSSAGVGAAAESYLRRYPHGARRWAVLTELARAGTSHLTCAEVAALATEFGEDAAHRATLRLLRATCLR